MATAAPETHIVGHVPGQPSTGNPVFGQPGVGQPRPVVCHHCFEPGHKITVCPRLVGGTIQTADGEHIPISMQQAAMNPLFHKLPYVPRPIETVTCFKVSCHCFLSYKFLILVVFMQKIAPASVFLNAASVWLSFFESCLPKNANAKLIACEMFSTHRFEAKPAENSTFFLRRCECLKCSK